MKLFVYDPLSTSPTSLYEGAPGAARFCKLCLLDGCQTYTQISVNSWRWARLGSTSRRVTRPSSPTFSAWNEALEFHGLQNLATFIGWRPTQAERGESLRSIPSRGSASQEARLLVVWVIVLTPSRTNRHWQRVSTESSYRTCDLSFISEPHGLRSLPACLARSKPSPST